jgi:hypothetical protein
LTTAGDPAAAIGRVRSALQRLSGAATGRAMLDAALESLAENFPVRRCAWSRRKAAPSGAAADSIRPSRAAGP